MRGGLPQAVRRRLDPEERYGLRVTLFAAALVLVTVPFATLLFQVLAGGPAARLDGALADRMNAAVHDEPLLLRMFQLITHLGRPVTLGVVVSIASVFVWRRGQRRLAVFLVVTVVGGGLVDSAVKILVDRPRPVVDHPVATAWGKSFPSGHAMSSTVTYGALLLTFLPVLPGRRRVAAVVATAGLVLVIGSSRLILGVHFLTDVIGGYVLGLAWLLGATAAFEIWRVELGGRRAEPLAEGVEPEAGPALRGDRAGPSLP
jgi:membrane-associated phospholipid phosphatase